jgi:hypothetical protein
LFDSKIICTAGAALCEFHALLRAKDPGLGGLARVMNKHQEFCGCMKNLQESFNDE